jgi:hypothetical protein
MAALLTGGCVRQQWRPAWCGGGECAGVDGGTIVRLESGPNCSISRSHPPTNLKMGFGLDHLFKDCFIDFDLFWV